MVSHLTCLERILQVAAWLCLVSFLLVMGYIFRGQVKEASANPSINLQVQHLDSFPKTSLIAIWHETSFLPGQPSDSVSWPTWPDFSYQGMAQYEERYIHYAKLVRPRSDSVVRRSTIANLSPLAANYQLLAQIRLSSFNLPFTFDKKGNFLIIPEDSECMMWGWGADHAGFTAWDTCDSRKDVLTVNLGNWSTCCIDPGDDSCFQNIPSDRGYMRPLPACSSFEPGEVDKRLMRVSSWPMSGLFLLATSEEDAPKTLQELTDLVTEWAVEVNHTRSEYPKPLLTKLSAVLQTHRDGTWLNMGKMKKDYVGVHLASNRCKGAGCADPNVKIASKLVDLSGSFTDMYDLAAMLPGSPGLKVTLLPDWDQTVTMGTVPFTYNNALSQLLSYANTGHSAIQFLFPTALAMGTMYSFGAFRKEATRRYMRSLGVGEQSGRLLPC